MTALVAFFIGGGGVAQIWQYEASAHGVVPVLGYQPGFLEYHVYKGETWGTQSFWGGQNWATRQFREN
jgi:hypothetical protein